MLSVINPPAFVPTDVNQDIMAGSAWRHVVVTVPEIVQFVTLQRENVHMVVNMTGTSQRVNTIVLL
jgi:hypothetical protein